MMKMTMKIGAAALVMACVGAPVLAEEISDIARIHCLQYMPRWTSSPALRTGRDGLPSFLCMQHYYGSSDSYNVNAFGVAYGMATRAEYDAWAMMVDAYRRSEAMQYVEREGPGTPGVSADRLANAEIRRNYEKVMQGYANILIQGNPWKQVRLSTESERYGATQCGDEQAMTISSIRDVGLRKAAQAEYDKRCGAEAQAKETKAQAEAEARKEARRPRLIDVSELENNWKRVNLPDLDVWAKDSARASVVIGVRTAPQVTLIVDLGSQASRNALRQLWPAIREERLSLKLIPVAVFGRQSDDAATLLASDTPTKVLRTLLHYGDDALISGAMSDGAYARYVRDAEEAYRKGVQYTGPGPKWQGPAAEKVSAAAAALKANTESARKAGLGSVPYGIRWTADGKFSTMGELLDGKAPNPLLAGIETKDLAYEPGIRSRLPTQFRPQPGTEVAVAQLTRKVCAAEGSSDCWPSLPEPKKGWW